MDLRTSDFTYDLPEELIAQEPVSDRGSSRLLLLDRSTGRVRHHTFRELPEFLRTGDRLVLNDTRVLPARLLCQKDTGAVVEMMFLEPCGEGRWTALVRPGRRLMPGTEVSVRRNSEVRLRIVGIGKEGTRIVESATPRCDIVAIIERHGRIPLPPYIRREATNDDRETYQTVYARNQGAVAAPTAGLHFTPDLIDRLRERGIDISFLTLHVGLGTFRPVKEEDPRKHPIHEERYELPAAAAEEIAATKASGGRIIAVGTTVVRTLEHCADEHGTLTAGSGRTRLMILPGHRFKVVDALITNFHLPGSTLLMLVSAFAGREPVLAAYGTAVLERYRFYSYGDAMAIL